MYSKMIQLYTNIYLVFFRFFSLRLLQNIKYSSLCSTVSPCWLLILRNLYAVQEVTELNMEQQTGSKLGKEYVKAVYCHPVYLTYMQSTSWEMLDWMKHRYIYINPKLLIYPFPALSPLVNISFVCCVCWSLSVFYISSFVSFKMDYPYFFG